MKKRIVLKLIAVIIIVLLISLIVFGLFLLPNLTTEINRLWKWHNRGINQQETIDRLTNCRLFIISAIIVTLLVIVAQIVFLICSKSPNFVRYTYEEYKEYRANKKAQKQADKKAKLQAELNKMEKAE